VDAISGVEEKEAALVDVPRSLSATLTSNHYQRMCISSVPWWANLNRYTLPMNFFDDNSLRLFLQSLQWFNGFTNQCRFDHVL